MTIHNRAKVLAIASGGGHWVQLWRMRKAWEDCDIVYVTTSSSRLQEISEAKKNQNIKQQFYCIVDANRWQRIKLIRQLISLVIIFIKERPKIVISTGAAPGYFALRIGKLLGARTIWVDSIANTEVLSLSGQKIEKYADLWLTQWNHLSKANTNSPQYKGSVI